MLTYYDTGEAEVTITHETRYERTVSAIDPAARALGDWFLRQWRQADAAESHRGPTPEQKRKAKRKAQRQARRRQR